MPSGTDNEQPSATFAPESAKALPSLAAVGEGEAPSDEARAAMVLEYTGRLWGSLEGFVHVASGVPDLDDRGRYRHQRRTWQERFFPWPLTDRLELVRYALELAPARDVYVCPTIRVTASGKKGAAGLSRFAYADVDGAWTVDRQATFDQLAPPGSFTVRSGSGGRHVYFDLGELLPGPELEDVNQSLVAEFGGDSKWSSNSLLRLPGCLNHKKRVRGEGEPDLVVFGEHVGSLDPGDLVLAAFPGSTVVTDAEGTR